MDMENVKEAIARVQKTIKHLMKVERLLQETYSEWLHDGIGLGTDEGDKLREQVLQLEEELVELKTDPSA